MSTVELVGPERSITHAQTISESRTITIENPDEYGGHLQHYTCQKWFEEHRSKILGIDNPTNNVNSVTIEYKQQLLGGEEVEVVSEINEPASSRHGLTFTHQIIKDGEPVIEAIVNCASSNKKNTLNSQEELEGLEFLTGIATITPIEQAGEKPHYTDSQPHLNKDRIDVFEACGMELREAAKNHGRFGFIRRMQIAYSDQPQPGETVKITTDVYRKGRTIFRFHQKILRGDVVITESIADCAIVLENLKPTRLPSGLLAKLRTHRLIDNFLNPANQPQLEKAWQLYKQGETAKVLELLGADFLTDLDEAREILEHPNQHYQSRTHTEPLEEEDVKTITAAIIAAMNEDYRGLTYLGALLITQPYDKQIIIAQMLGNLTDWAYLKVGQKNTNPLTKEQIFEWARLIREGKVKLTPDDEKGRS